MGTGSQALRATGEGVGEAARIDWQSSTGPNLYGNFQYAQSELIDRVLVIERNLKQICFMNFRI